MKLIIAENLDTAKNISSTFDYNTTIIILSKNTGEIINSIDWTELYVAVGNEKFCIADLKVVKMVNENYTADIHEVSNWINELKDMYIYNHIDKECAYFKRIPEQEIIKTTRKND